MSDTIRVLSIPAGHPYVAHLADPDGPDGVVRLPDPPVPGSPPGQWWPPVALDADWIGAHAGEFDVAHVHFGVEGRTLRELDAWLAALRAVRRPLVFTVHDLHNPHLADNGHHRAQLDRLVTAADVVLTLTPRAAREIEARWGGPVRVVPHPHVVPLDRIDEYARDVRGLGDDGDDFVVGVHLKSLRADLDPVVLSAVADAVEADPRLRLRVDVNAGALDGVSGPVADASRAWLAQVAGRARVALHEHPRFADDELFAYLAGLDLAVLPYAFGTHSGWLETCVDVGTDVLAPAHGCYADQHPIRAYDAADPTSVARGIAESLRAAPGRRPLVTADSRREQRREIAAAHRRAYADALAAPWRRLASRRRAAPRAPEPAETTTQGRRPSGRRSVPIDDPSPGRDGVPDVVDGPVAMGWGHRVAESPGVGRRTTLDHRARRVLHVVVGPDGHGVVRHAVDLLEAPALAGHETLRLPDAAALDAAVADGRLEGAWVHLHATDRLLGEDAPDRLGRVARVAVAAAGRLGATLHDLPQPHDDGPTGRARAGLYADVSRIVGGCVVASEHERELLRRAGGLVSRCAVVPLPLAPRDRSAERVARAGGDRPRTVGVLGFLYPGKGHDVAVRAMVDLPPDVALLALGRPSPGHEDLADTLAAAAAAQGREATVTGYLPDAELTARLRAVSVPVAPHEHVSASGSIGTWLSAGRRPIVADGPWVRELLARLPGCVVVVDVTRPGALAAAIADALADPASTWLPTSVTPAPDRDTAAAEYARLLDTWAGES